MSRNNRKKAIRKRPDYTGEAHNHVRDAIPDGPPWIPGAPNPAQQLVESVVLHRLVQGARAQWPDGTRPKHPLFIASASPSAQGLKLVVPVGDARAFGAALAGGPTSGVHRPSGDITIRRAYGSDLYITVTGAETGVIRLCCAWSELYNAIDDGRGPALSATEVHLAGAGLWLAEDEQEVLSSLLRRIVLFSNDPEALDWLFAWHRWSMLGRTGTRPGMPVSLIQCLTEEGFSPGSAPCRALGIDGSIDPVTAARSGKRPELTPAGVSEALGTPPAVAPVVAATSTSDDQGQQAEPASGVYRHLAIAALCLDPDNPIRQQYHLMRFPQQWKELLGELATAGAMSDRIGSFAELNEAITAVLPDCVVVRPGDRDGGGPYWLLARHPVNPEMIFRLVTAWVRSQETASDLIQALLARLHPSELFWEPVRIGPGVPYELLYRLVPMEVAARLAQPDAPVPFAPLRFVRCPSTRGAEVMSWPPQPTDTMEFSVTIKISVQTRPFTVEPAIHLEFGIRRWMPVRGRLSVGHAHPAYVALEPSAVDGQQDARAFGIANLTLAHEARQSGGAKSWLTQWSPTLMRVLSDAGLAHLLPDAESLVADPTTWLHHHKNPAALTYRAGMLAWEKVSDGLPVIDRAGLMDWAAGELAPHLRSIQPLPRVAARIFTGLTRTGASTISPEGLADVVGPNLTVELRTRTTEGLDHALSRLRQLLGNEVPRSATALHAEKVVDLGPITVTIRRRGVPEAPADLALDRPWTGDVARAYGQDMARKIGHAAHPTVVLVENAYDDVPGIPLGDVRTALRLGLAITGRLSGFVTSAQTRDTDGVLDRRQPGAGDEARFARAVDDLFRQLGVRPTALPEPAPNTLTHAPAQLAIWMIPAHDHGLGYGGPPVPLAVLIDPTGRHIRICIPGFPWQPLHTGLLALAGYQYAASTGLQPDPLRFIREAILGSVTEHPDTLLLTHAQNLRHAWPQLMNPSLDIDTIDLGDGPRPISTLPGLRHVRVRTWQYGETPQCHGTNGTTIGQPKGLWRYPEPRLFASTIGKPALAAESRLHNSKIANGDRYGKITRINTRAQVWNEQLVELAVVGLQDGDQPDHWAALVHNLRDAAPYVHWSTPLPLALQLAQQIGDYLPLD